MCRAVDVGRIRLDVGHLRDARPERMPQDLRTVLLGPGAADLAVAPLEDRRLRAGPDVAIKMHLAEDAAQAVRRQRQVRPANDELPPEDDLVVLVLTVRRGDVAQAELLDAVHVHRLDALRLLPKGAERPNAVLLIQPY